MDGGFCELVSVPTHMLFKANTSIPDRHVALVELYAIGFHANKRAQTKPGDTIVIWGAGRVGQVILQAARTKTDGKIFLVDPLDARLKIASGNYENVVTINPLKENPVDIIKTQTNGNGVDIAFEAVGHAESFDGVPNPVRGCVQSIRGGGTVCVLGLGDEPAGIVFKEMIWKEAKIVSSRVSDGEFSEVLEHLQKGDLKPDALISKVMHGSQTQEAFELLQKEKSNYLKILLDFNHK
jgi:threonine dehydrogenase-like Zn-dependent dehydrogenase